MAWQEAFPLFLRPPDSRSFDEIDQEILDELDFHIEMRTRANLGAGMSAGAARRDAVQRFGDFKRIHGKCRKTLLGERIMLQRVQAVLMLVLVGAVAYLSVQLYCNQQANQRALNDMAGVLAKLADRGPVVLHTTPNNGDLNVDPSLSEIRVCFDREMLDGSWSWCYDPDLLETTGDPCYESDRKTCVLPVKLQPDREYVIRVNTEQFRNFQDASGRAAVPCLLRFKTRAAAQEKPTS